MPVTSAGHAFLGLVLVTLGGQLRPRYEIVVASLFGTGREADALALGLTYSLTLRAVAPCEWRLAVEFATAWREPAGM